MKDELKAKFDKVLSDQALAARKKLEDEQKRSDELNSFITDAQNMLTKIVVPALKEVEQLLKRQQWQCNITSGQDAIEFVAYKGDMRGMTPRSRPTLQFKIDLHAKKIAAFAVSASQSGGIGKPVALSELTEESVQNIALEFINRISSETGRY